MFGGWRRGPTYLTTTEVERKSGNGYDKGVDIMKRNGSGREVDEKKGEMERERGDVFHK